MPAGQGDSQIDFNPHVRLHAIHALVDDRGNVTATGAGADVGPQARAAIGVGARGAGTGAGDVTTRVGAWISGAPSSTFARFTSAK